MRGYKSLPGLGRMTRLADKINAYPWTDYTNRMESFNMRYNRTKEALEKYHEHKNFEKLLSDSGIYDLSDMEQIKAIELLSMDTVPPSLINSTVPLTGEEAFARYLALGVTNNTHWLYERSQRPPSEQSPVGIVMGNLFVFPRSYAQRIIKLGQKLVDPDVSFKEKVYASKTIAGIIIMGMLMGEIFKRLTGKSYNAYHPLTILSWSPGGLTIGVLQELSSVLYEMLRAIQGDEDALGRLTSILPRVATLQLPFYKHFIDAVEGLTDLKNVDRYALRKLREFIDAEYKTRDSAYQADRDFPSMLQHILFGGEMRDLPVPENEEVKRIREVHKDLFEQYAGMGDKDSEFYIEDEDERAEARRKLLEDNPEFAKDRRRLEMYDKLITDEAVAEAYKGTEWWKRLISDLPLFGDNWAKEYIKVDTQLVEWHVEYGLIVDKFGANSAEAMLFRWEHPDYSSFGESEMGFEWEPLNLSEQDVKRYKLVKRNRELLDLRDSYSDKKSDNYIDDADKRQEAIDKLYADNPQFQEDVWRMDALAHNATSDKIVEGFVGLRKIQNEFGDSSPEAKVYLLDHPELFEWGQLAETFGWQSGSDWNEKELRLRVKYGRDLDKYYGFSDPDSDYFIAEEKEREKARLAMLLDENGEPTQFYRDLLRIEAYQKGYADENVDKYMEYSLLPTWGDWRERYLLDPANESFYMEWLSGDVGQGHIQIDPGKVSPEARDIIYEEFLDQFQAWDETDGMTEAEVEALHNKLLQVEGFAEARIKVQAYDDGVPESYIDMVVEFKQMPIKGYDQERFLQKNEDFYRDVWLGVWGNKPIDFTKVPSEKVEALLEQYDALPAGEARLKLRCKNKELDDWLVNTKGFTPCYGTDRCIFAPPTEPPAEEVETETEKTRRKTIWEQLEEQGLLQDWMKKYL